MKNSIPQDEYRSPEIPVVGDRPSIELWHGEPNVHGTNPMGWPLYRVIWSESRYYLLGGEWGDNGSIEYRWAPYYAGRSEWVLEKWLAPEEYAGPEAQWAADNLANVTCSTCRGMGVEQVGRYLRRCKLCEGSGQVPCAVNGILVYTMGPYPKLGWYDHCFSFPQDREPNLECIVPLLEASRALGFARLKQGLQACHDTMRREWENRFEACAQDVQGAFHNLPSNVNPGKVTADRVSIGNEQEFRAALRKQKGIAPPITEAPEDLHLPAHGFSIKQRRD
jgi:hypothetical protein